MFPIQSVYVEPNDIADLHRSFDIMHQASHFYLATQETTTTTSSRKVKTWLEQQMPAGLAILQSQMQQTAQDYQQQPLLHQALLILATLEHSHLSFYEKAYLGLAISKTRMLLANPSEANYKTYLKFLTQIKPANSSFSHICTLSLLFIAGFIGVSLGIGAGLGLIGLSTVFSITCILSGSLCLGIGLYHHQTKPRQMPSQTCVAVETIAECIQPG